MASTRPGTDVGVNEDAAGGAEPLRAPGDAAPVVAVGRAAHRDAAGRRRMHAGDEVGGGRMRRHAAPGQLGPQHAQHGVSAAERLEAAEPEPRASSLMCSAATPACAAAAGSDTSGVGA